MVDFRYHLVSLGAVFIALAVGIILGAGPLQNSIGEALNSQVDSLSVANEELKADNDELATRNAQQEAAIADVAPTLVTETLTNRQIALVTLPGTTEDDVVAARDRLLEAGGVIATEITVNEAWTADQSANARSRVAGQLDGLVPGLESGSDENTILSSALVTLLRDGSADISNILLAGDDPLITLTAGDFSAVEAIVIIAADTDDSALESDSAQDADLLAQAERNASAFSALVAVVAQGGPTVVSGAADSATDVVRIVRDAGTDASTVDNLPDAVGSVNVAVAVASELNATLVHLGYDDGAERVIGLRTESPAPQANAEQGASPAESATEDEQ